MESEELLLRTAAIVSAVGQTTAAALGLAGLRRMAAGITVAVAGGFLLVTAFKITQVGSWPYLARFEIALLVSAGLGLLISVAATHRPNKPLFWLAWILTSAGPAALVFLAFFFRSGW